MEQEWDHQVGFSINSVLLWSNLVKNILWLIKTFVGSDSEEENRVVDDLLVVEDGNRSTTVEDVSAVSRKV